MKTDIAKEVVKTLRSTALVADCTGCGKSNGLYWPEFNDHYCPECTKERTLFFGAETHFIELLKERVIPVWVEHYRAQGLDAKSFKDILGLFAYDARLEKIDFEGKTLEQTA
jgi:hypothetical protein